MKMTGARKSAIGWVVDDSQKDGPLRRKTTKYLKFS